jgi:hypothetical protein
MDASQLSIGGTADDHDAGKIHRVPLIEDETGNGDQSVRLALIFGGHIGIVDALLMKIDAAVRRPEYLIDLAQQS